MGVAEQASNKIKHLFHEARRNPHKESLFKRASNEYKDIQNTALKNKVDNEADVLQFRRNLRSDNTQTIQKNYTDNLIENKFPSKPISGDETIMLDQNEITKSFNFIEDPSHSKPYKFEEKLNNLLKQRPSMDEVSQRMANPPKPEDLSFAYRVKKASA